jgi:hypothetical protein
LRDYSSSRRTRAIFLSASLALVVILSVYPYIPSINSDFQSASVDAQYYVEQINIIRSGGIFAEGGPLDSANERALSILIFYGLAQIVAQPAASVVAFLPVFLGGLMVFSTYFLVRSVAGKGSMLVLVAPLIVALSRQFIVGIYGGFFSNMLALSVGFVMLLFFFKYQQTGKWGYLGLFILTLFFVMFIHVYTWVFFSAVVLLAVGILAFNSVRAGSAWKAEASKYLPVVAGVAATGAVLLGIASQTSGVSGVDFLSGLASESLSEDYFAKRWFNMNYTFRIYVGGFLNNPLAIILALVWAFRADYKNVFNVLLLASIFVSSFFFLFGDSVVLSRMFYNIPLQIPVAIMIANIAAGKYMGWLGDRTRLLVVALMLANMATYAFSAVANFYLVTPENMES